MPTAQTLSATSDTRRSLQTPVVLHAVDQTSRRVVEQSGTLLLGQTQALGRPAHGAELLVTCERHPAVAVREVDGVIRLGQVGPGAAEGDVLAAEDAHGNVIAAVHDALHADSRAQS